MWSVSEGVSSGVWMCMCVKYRCVDVWLLEW